MAMLVAHVWCETYNAVIAPRTAASGNSLCALCRFPGLLMAVPPNAGLGAPCGSLRSGFACFGEFPASPRFMSHTLMRVVFAQTGGRIIKLKCNSF